MEGSSFIGSALPGSVVAVEAFADLDAVALRPGEEMSIRGCSPGRRREFGTTRDCAHRALARLGRRGVSVPNGADRAPIWPAGVIGSITHCVGYRAAAVARAGELSALGIDAEPHQPLTARVFAGITVAAERARHALLHETAAGIHFDRVLFSAKESVYKAWYPLTRAWLGFLDADVALRADGTFVARLLTVPAVSGPGAPRPVPSAFTGHWRVGHGLVVTTVTASELPNTSFNRSLGAVERPAQGGHTLLDSSQVSL